MCRTGFFQSKIDVHKFDPSCFSVDLQWSTRKKNKLCCMWFMCFSALSFLALPLPKTVSALNGCRSLHDSLTRHSQIPRGIAQHWQALGLRLWHIPTEQSSAAWTPIYLSKNCGWVENQAYSPAVWLLCDMKNTALKRGVARLINKISDFLKNGKRKCKWMYTSIHKLGRAPDESQRIKIHVENVMETWHLQYVCLLSGPHTFDVLSAAIFSLWCGNLSDV